MAERDARGPYRSIFDLTERIDPKVLTKGMLEILIKAGCLDCSVPTAPSTCWWSTGPSPVPPPSSVTRPAARSHLFGGDAAASNTEAGAAEDDAAIPPAEDWPHGQKLAFEKEVFGFYLTSHPLTQYADQLDVVHPAKGLASPRPRRRQGSPYRRHDRVDQEGARPRSPARNGHSKYVNFDLEDPTGVVRCIMWPEDFAREGEKIQPEAIVIVKGRTDARGREPNIIVNKVLTLDDAEKEFTRQIAIKFTQGLHDRDDMQRVQDILSRFPGKTPVVIVLETTLAVAQLGNGTRAAGNSDDHGLQNGGSDGVTPNRVKAYLTCTQQVSARGELRNELVAILGTDGLRFQTEAAGQA